MDLDLLQGTAQDKIQPILLEGLLTSSDATKYPNTHLDQTVPKRIVLTGFMGAGKSTVGALLAQKLGWKFVDLDEEIVRAEQRSIAAIFEFQGEEAFRELERIALSHALAQSRIVLALGGGAMENPAILRLLIEGPDTLLLYLQAPLEALLARCEEQQRSQPQAALRPVLANRNELKERFQRRVTLYQSAHLIIDTAERSPDDVVQTILMQWINVPRNR